MEVSKLSLEYKILDFKNFLENMDIVLQNNRFQNLQEKKAYDKRISRLYSKSGNSQKQEESSDQE